MRRMDDGLSIGPLERTLIQRAIASDQSAAAVIVEAVKEHDPLNVRIPRLLPADFADEAWYVESDYQTGIHRLVVSFTAPAGEFKYNQAFVTIRNVPAALTATMANEVEGAMGCLRLSRYVDMTALGSDPCIIMVSHAEDKTRLFLERFEDLESWKDFKRQFP